MFSFSVYVFVMNISFVCLWLALGRESRLALTIKGEGVGPKLQLNYNLLDMKNVFINDKNCYEVRKLHQSEYLCPFRKIIG